MKTKILIVDDHPIYRMGMRELLNQENDFVVCGLAADMAEARRALAEQDVDMAIIDITLADENGLDLIREIRSSGSDLAILVLSMHDESVWAERAIRAGARGYIMKKEASESVVCALRNIRKGQIHVSPDMVSILLDRMHQGSRNQGTCTVDLLTDRELEVFRLIGSGLTTRKIALKMHLSIKTIGTYRDRIKQNLGLKNGTELSRRAVLWVEQESPGTNKLIL